MGNTWLLTNYDKFYASINKVISLLLWQDKGVMQILSLSDVL